MNLIEQLGGYDRASKIANCKSGVVHPTKPLLDALLEYRRANNIFEVGDAIIRKWNGRLYWIIVNVDNGGEFLISQNQKAKSKDCKVCDMPCNFKHATDEEIKAGHRISHTDNLSHFDHCTDIRNHLSPLTGVTER